MKASNTVKAARTVLAAAGIALLGYGLLGLPTQLGPEQLIGLLTWMAVAVLIHDGVIVPLSTLAGAGLTRAGSKLQPPSAAVLRGTLLTGAVVTLIAAILVKAQSVARGTTVLEANYAASLVWLWAVLAIGSAATIFALERRVRRPGRVPPLIRWQGDTGSVAAAGSPAGTGALDPLAAQGSGGKFPHAVVEPHDGRPAKFSLDPLRGSRDVADVAEPVLACDHRRRTGAEGTQRPGHITDRPYLVRADVVGAEVRCAAVGQ